MSSKKILLEKANRISAMEKEYVRQGKIPDDLQESWDIFEAVDASKVLKRPFVIVKTDMSESDAINESSKIITEAYLTKKDKNFLSFLEFQENSDKPEHNLMIEIDGYEEAKKFCDLFEKDEFYIVRENFAYKVIKRDDKWAPILQTKTDAIFKLTEDTSARHYQILGKKYKTLF